MISNIIKLLGGVTAVIFLSNIIKSPKEKFEKAIIKASKFFDSEILKNCERIYRLETNHFKSGQFLGTYSAGMEAFGSKFPWGWNSLKKLWTDFPHFSPVDVKAYDENRTGKVKRFLVFPSMYSAVFTLCYTLNKRGNNPGSWFSKDAGKQASYNKLVAGIEPKIVNKLLTKGII